MKGSILTKEKCPKCGGQFQGEPLLCPTCLTAPRRYFLRLYWKTTGGFKIYTGRDGYPLDSWERAHRLLTVIRNEMDEGKFDPRNYLNRELKALVCENYFAAWLKRQEVRHHRLKEISLGYLKYIAMMVQQHLVPFFGRKSIKDIDRAQVKRFKDELLARYQPKTVQNILGVLRAILSDAKEREDIETVPTFPKVNVPEPEIRWIDEEDQNKILEHVRHPVYRGFFLFLMKMGCRPNEARALRGEDVDLKKGKGLVVIKAAMDGNTYRPTTKEGDVRHLALHPEVWRALKKLPTPLRQQDYVFSLSGKPLRKNQVSDTWRRAAKKAGIKITLYQGTKHSMGCQLVNQGVPLEMLAAWFGHKDVRTTKRYAKIDLTGRKNIWEGVSPKCPQAMEGNGKT
jgi:integrase